jgi:hypothetical protein
MGFPRKVVAPGRSLVGIGIQCNKDVARDGKKANAETNLGAAAMTGRATRLTRQSRVSDK